MGQGILLCAFFRLLFLGMVSVVFSKLGKIKKAFYEEFVYVFSRSVVLIQSLLRMEIHVLCISCLI
jgi:hypothetical protein